MNGESGLSWTGALLAVLLLIFLTEAPGGGGDFGVTVMPSLIFCSPSATTRSPGLSPSSTTHRVPVLSPALIDRISTLLSEVTTAT